MILTDVQKRMVNTNKTSVYASNNNIVIDADNDGEIRITGVNGMTRTYRVHAGHNTFPVQKGIHIVTVNNQSTKLYVK